MGFTSLVRKNKPLSDLIQSKTTYVNEELAKFYKLKGVKGNEMRLVAHTDKRRYGLFGQASVLAVTSSPYRTSPIRRGEWILDSLLGTPHYDFPECDDCPDKQEECTGLNKDMAGVDIKEVHTPGNWDQQTDLQRDIAACSLCTANSECEFC